MMHEGYIITSNDTKNKIIQEEKGLKNYKFLTPSLLKDMLYGSFLPDSIIFLNHKYNLSIPEAIEIIKYLPLVDLAKEYSSLKLRGLQTLKKVLIDNNYYSYNPLAINDFKRYNVTFLNNVMDKLTLNMVAKLKEITNVYIENDSQKYLPTSYYEYPNEELEVFNAFLDCKRVLKENKKANIYFLNTNDSYYSLLKRLANSFKISINLPSNLSIISNNEAKKFLKGLKENKTYKELISEVKNPELKNYIISIINKYNLDTEGLSKDKELFSYLFRNKKYPADIYDKAIRMGSIFNSYGDNDYVYLFNFNSDFPLQLKDEGYLNKNDLNELGLDDYIQSNQLNRDYTVEKLTKIRNLKISFPKRILSSDNIKSELVDSLNLKPIIASNKTLGISEAEDILSLGAMLDDYNLYGIFDEALKTYNLDKVNYLKFDNSFKGFTEDFIKNHAPSLPIKMSYSNVKLYYSCPFNYYLDRILKLAKFEGTMATHIGSYAHEILEKSYQPNFDFEAAKAEGKEALTKKEQFFASLMDDVVADVLTFNQKHELEMQLDKTLCEHEFTTLKENPQASDFDQDINFFGYIDKIKYKEDKDKVYIAIYDYKTGGDMVSLNNVVDGENLQLPSYLFLLNKDSLFANKEVIILGMYLQKVNITLIDGLRDKKEQREAGFKLKGFSTNNRKDLTMLDPGFTNSTYIQGMRTKADGDFYGYTKLYNEKAIDNLLKIVPDLLEKLKNAIYSFNFPINPLRIDGKSNACRFCQYKRICYKNEHNYNDKEEKPFTDLMEDDYHGLD